MNGRLGSVDYVTVVFLGELGLVQCRVDDHSAWMTIVYAGARTC